MWILCTLWVVTPCNCSIHISTGPLRRFENFSFLFASGHLYPLPTFSISSLSTSSWHSCPLHLTIKTCMLYRLIGSISSSINPRLSMVLTFRVSDPNSLAGVFKTFWFPFPGFGWSLVANMFYRVGLLTPRPNPNLKVWVITFMGVPASQAGSGWNILILLASCQQTYMTYIIIVCTVKDSWW